MGKSQTSHSQHHPDTLSTAILQKFEGHEGLPLDDPEALTRERRRRPVNGQQGPTNPKETPQKGE